MSEETVVPERHDFCRNLRTKSMYVAADMIEVEEDLANDYAEQSFWCMHTMTDTGPDDGYVEHRRCRPGRTCYDPLGG